MRRSVTRKKLKVLEQVKAVDIVDVDLDWSPLASLESEVWNSHSASWKLVDQLAAILPLNGQCAPMVSWASMAMDTIMDFSPIMLIFGILILIEFHS